MTKSRRFTALWAAFALFAAVALFASWFVFEVRYMWFVDVENFRFLRVGFLVGIGLIIVSWAAYPSRLFVAATGTSLFLFPPILRSSQYVPIDGALLAWACGAVALLLVATELDIRARRLARS